jgi:hypothetical protein
MAIPVLILGESGTGKSTSLRNLPQAETFLISVIDKPLPFRNKYKKFEKDKDGILNGNLFITDNYSHIMRTINYVNLSMPHIKNIIIDDFQYIMANEFMRRSTERGYDKFTEMAKQVWEIIDSIKNSRPDLTVFILSHSDQDASGKFKMKTIGKLLDEKITVEGLFTIILHTQINEGRYGFITQNDGRHVAKSPIDLFKDKYIDNDLLIVQEAISNYYSDMFSPEEMLS